MEVEMGDEEAGQGRDAGQSGTDPPQSQPPPALSTRAQQRRMAKDGGKSKGVEGEAKLDVMLKTMANLMNTVKQLQEGQTEVTRKLNTVETQNERLQRQSETLQRQNEDLNNENKILQTEIRKLQEQISEMSQTNSTNASATKSTNSSEHSPRRSWVSLFGGQTSISPHSSASQEKVTPNELIGVNVDLSKCRQPPPNDTAEMKSRITAAIQSHEETKAAQPTAVVKTNRDLHRVRILVRTEREAELLRANTQWLETHFSGARIRGEQWYPIKVDRVDQLKIMNDDRSAVRAGIERKLSEENQVSIMRISTLGKPAAHKLYCSIVVYLKTKEDAAKLLKERIMTIEGEGGFTCEYEYRPRVTRCFNCQEYGHQAYRCQKPQRCLRCSEPGHATCTASEPRCVSCKGPHTADDRGCPKYREQLRRLHPINGQ